MHLSRGAIIYCFLKGCIRLPLLSPGSLCVVDFLLGLPLQGSRGKGAPFLQHPPRAGSPPSPGLQCPSPMASRPWWQEGSHPHADPTVPRLAPAPALITRSLPTSSSSALACGFLEGSGCGLFTAPSPGPCAVPGPKALCLQAPLGRSHLLLLGICKHWPPWTDGERGSETLQSCTDCWGQG